MPDIIKQQKSSMQKLKPATHLGFLAKPTDFGHGNFHSLNSAQVSSKQSLLFSGDCFVAYRIYMDVFFLWNRFYTSSSLQARIGNYMFFHKRKFQLTYEIWNNNF